MGADDQSKIPLVRFSRLARRIPVAWIVLGAGVALSLLAWNLTASRVEREVREHFLSATRAVAATLDNRARAYEDLLHALQGLFLSSSKVTQAEFSRFLRTMRLSSRYPGIFATTYAEYVRREQRAEFEKRVRLDDEIGPPTGMAFNIKPPGMRPEYLVLLLVEPVGDLNDAYGLDLLSDPTRKIAADRARDTGIAVASGPYQLVAQAGAGRIASSLRQAIYRMGMPLDTTEQRRRAFQGMVSVAFVISDLGMEALRDHAQTEMQLRITDSGFGAGAAPGVKAGVIFENHKGGTATASGVLFQDRRTVNVGTRRWQLDFAAPRNAFVTPANAALPWIVLGGTLAISLLLSVLVHTLVVRGRRAIELADRITEDLRASEARLSEAQHMTQELIEALPNPIFFKGTDGRYLGVNKAWENFFGIPRSEFIGHTVHELYPHDQPTADRLHAMDQELWRSPGSQNYEANITPRGGGSRDTIYYKATYQNADGKVAGLIGTIVDITEHKKIEKALRDSESRYRSVIAAIAEGIIVRDGDARIVECNASAERILGMSIDQMLGNRYFNPDWETIREDGSPFPAEDRPVNAALRTGQPQSNVVTGFRRSSSDTLWLQLNAQPLFEQAGGETSGVVTTITDITERKQAELRQKMEHAVTLVLAEAGTVADAIPQIIRIICQAMGWNCGASWIWDKEAMLLRCGQMWGIDAPEIREFLISSTDGTIKPEPAGQGLVRRTYTSGQPVWIADVTKVPGLKRRAPMVTKAGLHGAFAFPLLLGNEVLGVLEFFHRDIREPDDMLIRISQSIGSQIGQFILRKETEQRYRTIFDNAAVGITQVGLDGILTDANQKFFDMLGYQRGEIIGKHIKEITHPEDYGQGAQWRQRLAKAESAGESIASEKRFLSKSGRIVWARRTMSVVYGGGRPEYLISVVEDITDRKLSEHRRAVEHQVTQTLSQSESLSGMQKILQIICKELDWSYGGYWQWETRTATPRCVDTWSEEVPAIVEFAAMSRRFTHESPDDRDANGPGQGGGLVRRVWMENAPLWLPDVSRETSLQRSAAAANAGLHGGFGFPITIGDDVIGVMEFFSREIRQPDPALLEMTKSIGSQVGQFIQRMRAEENLQFVATHDILTELPNRYLFSQCLKQALSRAQRNNRMIGVMFLDLDHFKVINDTLGHEAGDDVLREVAARLAGCVRKSDVVSRRGGDEFVVLIDDLADRSPLEIIATKILGELSIPFMLKEHPYQLTVSVGIGTYPGDGSDADTPLKNADIAMYRAKDQGRNAYRFYAE